MEITPPRSSHLKFGSRFNAARCSFGSSMMALSQELVAFMPAIRPSALLTSSKCAGGQLRSRSLLICSANRDGVVQQLAAGLGDGGVGDAGVARILLALDQADFFPAAAGCG